MPRVVSPRRNHLAQPVIARPSERDAARFAALVVDGGYARFGRELRVGLETAAHVSELGKNLRGAHATIASERHDDLAVGQLRDVMLDARRQLRELGDDVIEPARQSADQLALGVGFGGIREPDGGSPEPREQVSGWATAAIPVLREERRETLLIEVFRALGSRIALDEGTVRSIAASPPPDVHQ